METYRERINSSTFKENLTLNKALIQELDSYTQIAAASNRDSQIESSLEELVTSATKATSATVVRD